jgi:Na+-translocating ferredoxin:NAD+ oxidoreductase subunit D
MFEVIISLMPAVIYKVFVFGWLGVFALATLILSALITEKTMSKALNIKSDLSDYTSIITSLLLFLSMNCNMTFFIYFIASFVAIALGKMVYGGFAKNIFNPAMVGWCFVMVSFPQFISKHLDYNVSLTFMQSLNIFTSNLSVDSFTSATPLGEYKPYQVLLLKTPEIFMLNMLTLAGGLYLIVRKIISPIFPIFLAIGTLVAIIAFNYKIIEASQLFFLYGPMILAAFYIITDPVSSPSLVKSQIIYSFGVGFVAILIGTFGAYPIGVAFAVVFMNSFNFIFDKLLLKGATKNAKNAK